MYKNIECIMLSAALAAAAAALICLCSSEAAAAIDSTQDYTPARFALLAAEINVSSLASGISNTRKVMVRTDTATGQSWVLELSVPGNADFRVSRAHWKQINQLPYPPQQ